MIVEGVGPSSLGGITGPTPFHTLGISESVKFLELNNLTGDTIWLSGVRLPNP